MNVTRTAQEGGATTYDPPIATKHTTDLRGDDLDFARLQWRAGLTALDSGLDVDVIKCDHFSSGDPHVRRQRYHVTIDGSILDVGHYGRTAVWYQLTGIAYGAQAAADKAIT